MDGDAERLRNINRVTEQVVDAAVKLHIRVGPGLLESVYETLLAKEVARRGLKVQRQLAVPLTVDGVTFSEGVRLDLLVEGTVVVEIRSVERVTAVHWKQVLTYIKMLDLPIGLLINFGGATLKEGLQRLVNGDAIPPLPRRLRPKEPDRLR